MLGISLMLLALLLLGTSIPLPFIPFSVWLRVAAWSSVLVAASIGLLLVRLTLAKWTSQGNTPFLYTADAPFVEQKEFIERPL
jgi:hypothetical protein